MLPSQQMLVLDGTPKVAQMAYVGFLSLQLKPAIKSQT